VLHALALTELRGNRLGLTRRSIRKILQYENDPSAGEWNWLFDRRTPIVEETHEIIVVRNALQTLLDDYPIVVLKPGTYVDVPELPRSAGGKIPDVYILNEGAIERWPCGARIISLLSTGIHENVVHYTTLSRYIPLEHCSHQVPAVLQAQGAKPPETHTLHKDIEFLVRTRYLKLFTHEKGDPRRREVPYRQPFEFPDTSVIELDVRANLEQTYLRMLAGHFTECESGARHG
jgi:hypothetical protein